MMKINIKEQLNEIENTVLNNHCDGCEYKAALLDECKNDINCPVAYLIDGLQRYVMEAKE